MNVEDYAARFDEEPGYLNFASVGPIGRTVREEQLGMDEVLGRGRFGMSAGLDAQDERVREAVAALTRFRPDQIAFQPNTSLALMHAVFGLTGTLALAASEFPSLPFAAVRAHEALGAVELQWITTTNGRVTPADVRDQLTDATTAVAVSLVDFRTGYLTDLEGIRQVIGDRMLIVDAIQGFGVVDAPYEVADVVASGGQKWTRAGWSTGFLALSDRAAEQLTPVFSGFPGSEIRGEVLDEVPPPARGVAAYVVSNPDSVAQARFAAALEEIASVTVPVLYDAIIDRTDRVIDLADEFGLAVVSSRAQNERAGIVVVEPASDQLTVLSASLHNHGISCSTRGGQVRLSAHASTDEDSFDMLRAAFISFSTAVNA